MPHAEYIEKRFGRRAEGMHRSIDAAAEGEGISFAWEEGLQELDAAFQTARASGVRAVPTFVFNGKWVVEGAQPAEKFLEALVEVARAAAPTDAADAACRGGVCEV